MVVYIQEAFFLVSLIKKSLEKLGSLVKKLESVLIGPPRFFLNVSNFLNNYNYKEIGVYIFCNLI